jgi:hypothetical protein
MHMTAGAAQRLHNGTTKWMAAHGVTRDAATGALADLPTDLRSRTLLCSFFF